MRTPRVDRWWAVANGLSGPLPVYDMSTALRPAYGAAITEPYNSKNKRLIPFVLVALARIQARRAMCPNGTKGQVNE